MATCVAGSSPPVALGASLGQALEALDPALASVVSSIADSVAEISAALRDTDVSAAGSTNSFGDDQIQADLVADDIIFRHLRGCAAVATASSEERSDILPMGGSGYTVAFDPLDGSSIFSANFAVGTIFGVWPGGTPLGQTGRQQAAAAYSVYGPRTLLVLAVPAGAGQPQPSQQQSQQQQQQQQQCGAEQPSQGQPTSQQQQGQQQQQQQQQQPSQPSQPSQQQHHHHHQQQQQQPSQLFDVLEFALGDGSGRGGWRLRHIHARLGSNKNVAPANIRAAKDNAAYEALVLRWISSGCKLRYSGGMVPDIHHILAKGGGVFCNPKSPSAPAKLRLLYECAPLALIVEAAGGVSHNGQGSILDLPIHDTSARSVIAVGSGPRVEECLEAMRAGGV